MKNIYSVFLLIASLLLTTHAQAQINIIENDTTVCPGTPITLNATIGTVASAFAIFTDDIFDSVRSIGFPFTFYGNTYTRFITSSNGFISFDTTNATLGSPYSFLGPGAGGVPGNQNCYNSVMGPYTDIDPTFGGSIEISTQGVAPNRRLVVTFCNIPMFQCTTVMATFQIVLLETTNEIELHIANKPSCATWNGDGAIEGVQNATGTAAVVVPGRNYPGSWTATNSSHKFTPSGTTYTVTSIPFNFYPNGLNSISWYNLTTGLVIGTGAQITVASTDTTSYRAVAEGCVVTTSDTVTINAANVTPAPVVTPVQYCINDPAVPLTANGTNLMWYTDPIGGTGSSTAPTPSTAATGTFTWYVSQTYFTCEGPRAAIQVTVSSSPLPLTNNVRYCKGDIAAPLTAVGQNLQWYTTASGGSPSYAAPTPLTTVADTFAYYVTQTINGCQSERAILTVVVLPNTTASITMDTNAVCDLNTVTVSSPSINPPGTIWTWDFSGGSAINNGGDAGPFTVNWNTPGSKQITLTTTYEQQCIAVTTASVEVNVTPNADFTLREDACLDDTVFIQASWNALEAKTYTWGFDGGEIINGSGISYHKIAWNTPGVKTVTLMADNSGCKSPVISQPITIHAAPPAKIDAQLNGGICVGDTINISANTSDASYSYDWAPANFFDGYNGAVSQAKILRAGNIYLTVKDQFGCPGRDSLYIDAQPCCELALPNAFSPNGDGRNETFRIITIGNSDLINFRVTNRWGQTIFETQNQGDEWNGTFNGTPQPMDSYYYYIKYRCANGTITEKKGDVMLLR